MWLLWWREKMNFAKILARQFEIGQKLGANDEGEFYIVYYFHSDIVKAIEIFKYYSREMRHFLAEIQSYMQNGIGWTMILIYYAFFVWAKILIDIVVYWIKFSILFFLCLSTSHVKMQSSPSSCESSPFRQRGFDSISIEWKHTFASFSHSKIAIKFECNLIMAIRSSSSINGYEIQMTNRTTIYFNEQFVFHNFKMTRLAILFVSSACVHVCICFLTK